VDAIAANPVPDQMAAEIKATLEKYKKEAGSNM
jgi:hypothetical protein